MEVVAVAHVTTARRKATSHASALTIGSCAATTVTLKAISAVSATSLVTGAASNAGIARNLDTVLHAATSLSTRTLLAAGATTTTPVLLLVLLLVAGPKLLLKSRLATGPMTPPRLLRATAGPTHLPLPLGRFLKHSMLNDAVWSLQPWSQQTEPL